MIFAVIVLANNILVLAGNENKHLGISTFSIVARDPEAEELGIAVASKFFAVGAVVPWAKANVGAIATQSFANTSFGWRGLELLSNGASPEEVIKILLRNDNDSERRQIGIVSADGKSATYTGKNCIPWAGGRNGENYAIQGNILTSEEVVIAMEQAFLNTKGTLADRLFAALIAGDQKGGDSRGKQSAAILIVKQNAGYGGYTDRAIDIRVDDHPEPFKELERLLKIAKINYAWNEAWTLFTKKNYILALQKMELAAKLAPENAEVLYDLAVIRLAAGDKSGSIEALKKSIEKNPNLKKQASEDNDFLLLKETDEFKKLIK